MLIRMKSSSLSRREMVNYAGAQAGDEEKIQFCSKVQAYVIIFGILIGPLVLALALVIAPSDQWKYSKLPFTS